MRKILSIFLFLLIISLLEGVVLASDSTIELKCQDKVVDPAVADTFELTVSSVGSPEYVTGTVKVTFDDDVFDLVHIKFNEALAPNYATCIEEAPSYETLEASDPESDVWENWNGGNEGTPVVTKQGEFVVDFGDDLASKNYDEAGVLFTLTFKITDKNAEGEFIISLEEIEKSFLNQNMKLVTVTPDDGSVKFGAADVKVVVVGKGENTPSYTLDGNVITVSYKDPCKLGYLNSEGQYVVLQVSKVNAGSYSYSIPADAQELILVVKGDIDGNGKLSVADFSQAKAAYTKKITLSPIQLFAGNVDKDDDKISVSEFSRIKAVYNKKIVFEW